MIEDDDNIKSNDASSFKKVYCPERRKSSKFQPAIQDSVDSMGTMVAAIQDLVDSMVTHSKVIYALS